MKKILVPTDFSVVAQNAYEYAQQLASLNEEMNITVGHVFMPPLETEYPASFPPVTELMGVREKMLIDFINNHKLQIDQGNVITQLSIENELLIGFPADEIVEASKEYDLIIMGMTGENDLIEKIMGSISQSVSKRAHCPVLLVPKNYPFTELNNILYASNYESAEDDMLEQLIAFNQPYQATVHFVHVNDNVERNYSKTKTEIFEELFENGEPTFAFEMDEINATSVREGLINYAGNNNIDLMIMVNHRRANFFERLVHKSQTKQMCKHIDRPLMVLHYRN